MSDPKSDDIMKTTFSHIFYLDCLNTVIIFSIQELQQDLFQHFS